MTAANVTRPSNVISAFTNLTLLLIIYPLVVDAFEVLGDLLFEGVQNS